MRTMWTGLLIGVGLATTVFVAMCLFLYLRQDSFLFVPRQNDAALAEQWRARRVEIPAGDHRIEGWWADNPAAASRAVVLYFGGNAEDVLFTAGTARELGASRLLVTNYRGYGRNAGRPGQAALFADALAVYDYAVTEAGIAPADIVVMGRSLGSGVATWLAAKRQVSGAILVTPYDSILRVAAHHYSVFPVRMLLRHPFPSQDLAAKATAPVLMIAAEHDKVIPPIHAQRLAQAWAGPVEIHVLPGMAHNDVERHPDYYMLISKFLGERGMVTGSES
jgi:pimeloyl-ACP methyl ester carboxylesterase